MNEADALALQAAIAGSRPPRASTLEGRVLHIGDAVTALLAGKMPADADRLFLAGSLASWLENGGDLARDHFRVVKPKSRRTASAIWRELKSHPDERQDGARPAFFPASSTDPEETA